MKMEGFFMTKVAGSKKCVNGLTNFTRLLEFERSQSAGLVIDPDDR